VQRFNAGWQFRIIAGRRENTPPVRRRGKIVGRSQIVAECCTERQLEARCDAHLIDNGRVGIVVRRSEQLGEGLDFGFEFLRAQRCLACMLAGFGFRLARGGGACLSGADGLFVRLRVLAKACDAFGKGRHVAMQTVFVSNAFELRSNLRRFPFGALNTGLFGLDGFFLLLALGAGRGMRT